MALHKKHKQYSKYEIFFKKFFTLRVFLAGIIVLLLLFLFTDFIKGTILVIIFIPMAVVSQRVSRFIPHINLETVTAGALLLTYMYNPVIGSIFTMTVGMYALIKASFVRFLMIINLTHSVMTLFIMILFKNLDFSAYFIIGILVKNLISYVAFVFLDPDQIQNIIHRISHTIFNIAIYRLFFILIYRVINLI
ncbi:hypothetical protein JXB41_06620 [Candidatus Woesearchaeota archaeon]|nr:hypothetical protein [Candidatus Woesearchaeota archaeon]